MAARERLICPSADVVEAGDGIRFDLDGVREQVPAFVIRYRGKAYGYLNRCAHVPMELDWQKGKFFDHSGLYLICATHGALYAPDSGRCMGGRCNGNGLKSLPVSEHDNNIFLIESD